MQGQRFSIEYWAEFRTHWRALIAAMLGLGFGMGFNAYTMPLFAPKLIAEFGWSKAEFALLGSFSVLMLVISPIIGRMTDRLGVRPVAALGVIGLALSYLALIAMPGDIKTFFALIVLQMMLGACTTSPVYTRLIAERFDLARGLAFSFVMAGPALAGLIAAGPLDFVIKANGWRSGFALVAVLSLVAGLLAIILMPNSPPSTLAQVDRPAAEKRADYALIFKSPAFWLVFGGMFLINMPQSMMSSQMKLVLVGSGATDSLATDMVRMFAVGVLIGRFACGLTLDRLVAHRVAAFTLGIPAIGMCLLASPFDTPLFISAAVLLMGLAQGAEGDVGAYLVSRRFDMKLFSLVMALTGAAIATGSSVGAVLMSYSIRQWGGYEAFLLISAALTVVGALLFLLLGRTRQTHDQPKKSGAA